MQTKEYQIMQIPTIESILSRQWNGNRSYETSMMESSVAFELLFRVPLKQHEDNEAIIRELSLTFDRPRA